MQRADFPTSEAVGPACMPDKYVRLLCMYCVCIMQEYPGGTESNI